MRKGGFVKRFMTQILAAGAVVFFFATIGAFASDKELSPQVKHANEAHSNAPAPVPEGSVSGSAANGAMATGESLQGLMSPTMTKLISEMKKCHRHHKTDQACHDGVIKKCEAKLTKEECGSLMAAIPANRHRKM